MVTKQQNPDEQDIMERGIITMRIVKIFTNLSAAFIATVAIAKTGPAQAKQATNSRSIF